MTYIARIACVTAIALLGGCASPSPVRHVTLDDGQPRAARTSTAPSVVVGGASVPELIDRPQLVYRTNGNQVVLSDQYRWAEPLRREIPRIIASDLGGELDSSAVAAVASGVEGVIVDFKVVLDFQRLDPIVGQGVEVDALWRLEHRSGNLSVGRSSFRQPLTAGSDDLPPLISAERAALRRIAADIAKEITVYQKCQREAAYGTYRADVNLAVCTVVNSTTGFR